MSRQGPLAHDEAQKRIKDRLDFLKRQSKDDMGWVLSNPAGRRFFWELLEQRCRLSSLSFSSERPLTDFNEGMRAVGGQLLEEAKAHHPQLYVEMVREQLEAQATDSIHRRDAIALTEREE